MLINWEFPDTQQRCALTLQNCALTMLPDRHAGCRLHSQARGSTFNRPMLRELALADALAQGLVRIAGNGSKLAQLLGLLDEFSLGFEIIEPLRAKR